jgi:hypothetical protein
MYKKELHNLYSSPNIAGVISKGKMEWAVCVTCMWRGKRNAYKMLFGKP